MRANAEAVAPLVAHYTSASAVRLVVDPGTLLAYSREDRSTISYDAPERGN